MEVYTTQSPSPTFTSRAAAAPLSLSSYLCFTIKPPPQSSSQSRIHMISGLKMRNVFGGKTRVPFRIKFWNIVYFDLNYKRVYIWGYRISQKELKILPIKFRFSDNPCLCKLSGLDILDQEIKRGAAQNYQKSFHFPAEFCQTAMIKQNGQ